ncbi:MAG: hypothetical protein ACI8QG_001778 [Flavobacteriales bacterium]|jgi:hypothetical protein
MTYLSRCVFLMIFVSPIGVANTLLDELSICAKNNDSSQRLVCYDKLTKETKNSQPKQRQASLKVTTTKKVDNAVQLAQKTQSEIVLAGSKISKELSVVQPQPTTVVDNTEKQQQAKFGDENKQRSEDLIQQIQATIVEVQKAPRGELILTLDNGQVWRQSDSTRLRLRKDQVVVIKRAALGSFFIGKENTNRLMRAKRVK